jgi:hypothetical protein
MQNENGGVIGLRVELKTTTPPEPGYGGCGAPGSTTGRD